MFVNETCEMCQNICNLRLCLCLEGKMSLQFIVVLSALVALTSAQRSMYAGFRPIGYPEMLTTEPTTTTAGDDLANKFGEDTPTSTTTTERIPIEALGDRNLVNRLSKLPVDKQPFWLINWKALEANRRRPQTYPQKGNSFNNNGVLWMQ